MSTKSLILYADDDNDDLELVKEVFHQHSQNVELVTVCDGLEALSFLKTKVNEENPCLIILDINMPRMDGKEALIEIRKMERFKEVPVILYTTSSASIDKDFAEKYNAGFLSKPIQFKQLDYIAAKFIDHCSAEIKKQITKRNK